MLVLDDDLVIGHQDLMFGLHKYMLFKLVKLIKDLTAEVVPDPLGVQIYLCDNHANVALSVFLSRFLTSNDLD